MLLQTIIIDSLTQKIPQDLNPSHYNVIILDTATLDLPVLVVFSEEMGVKPQSKMLTALQEKVF